MKTIYAAIAAMIGLLILAGTGMAKECTTCKEATIFDAVSSNTMAASIMAGLPSTMASSIVARLPTQMYNYFGGDTESIPIVAGLPTQMYNYFGGDTESIPIVAGLPTQMVDGYWKCCKYIVVGPPKHRQKICTKEQFCKATTTYKRGKCIQKCPGTTACCRYEQIPTTTYKCGTCITKF